MTSFGSEFKFSQLVNEFLKELEDDLAAPGQSKFQDYMPKCRKGMQAMEESLSTDKSHVQRLVTSMKEMFRYGEAHGQALATCADDLVKVGTDTSTKDQLLGNCFVKFGTLLNQMSSLLTNMVSSSKNILLFSLNLLFENELKGSKYKSDMKAMFGQYQSARNQVERDEKKALVAAGQNVADHTFSAEELAGKLILERRKFQMGVCEYMLKVNDVKTKNGVDLAEHLISFYQAQESYFKDGNTLLQALKQWEGKLNTQMHDLRAIQDEERKRLVQARDSLRNSMGVSVKLQGPSQVDPSSNTGLHEKTGYLAKRPDGAIRIGRRQWPKRYCTVNLSGFTMSHSHTHAPHVSVPLMHFQFKDCPELIDGRKYCFKLITQSRETRTYTFDAESEKDLMDWRQTMQNCQLMLFQGEVNTGLPQDRHRTQTRNSGSAADIVKSVITKIKKLPGNNRCCDCGCPDPDWLSVNLGILICIHCSGRHRELSVQFSRIRSLTLDAIKTSELLIAYEMGNDILNEVLEANLPEGGKLSPDAPMEKRQEYIASKYIQRKFMEHTIEPEQLLHELFEVVESRDIKQLLQVYAEGVDLNAPLPDAPGNRTALHCAIESEDLTSLHIVDFLLGNGRTENTPDADGNTPLHLAVEYDVPQCVKLLLNHGANIAAKNNKGKTPLDISGEKNFDDCTELLEDAAKKKFTKCEHIDVDWGVEDDNSDVYQVPVVTPPHPGGMKRSGTDGALVETAAQAQTQNKITIPPSMRTASSGPQLQDTPRKRPMSQFVDLKKVQPFRPPPPAPAPYTSSVTQPTSTTPSSDSAPPPPPRTVSKTVEALPGAGNPVAPRRKKKGPSGDGDSNQCTSPVAKLPPIPQVPERPQCPAPNYTHAQVTSGPQSGGCDVVIAQYDCDPDHQDELGFREGDRLVVVKKLNQDWWQGYVEGKPGKVGVFPVNHVLPVNQTD